MRNTTKLKTLLLKYTVSFDMDADGLFTLLLIDKNTNHTKRFEGESYSKVLAKAYSYLLKEVKHIKATR
ncbi:MAG: hypothetical protein KIS94_11675 [Chitinophagales bacterium]|nr:hypothetical protein [Chitinophagales bacterium]